MNKYFDYIGEFDRLKTYWESLNYTDIAIMAIFLLVVFSLGRASKRRKIIVKEPPEPIDKRLLDRLNSDLIAAHAERSANNLQQRELYSALAKTFNTLTPQNHAEAIKIINHLDGNLRLLHAAMCEISESFAATSQAQDSRTIIDTLYIIISRLVNEDVIRQKAILERTNALSELSVAGQELKIYRDFISQMIPKLTTDLAK